MIFHYFPKIFSTKISHPKFPSLLANSKFHGLHVAGDPMEVHFHQQRPSAVPRWRSTGRDDGGEGVGVEDLSPLQNVKEKETLFLGRCVG